jgi:deoxycytidylate deaminase
MRHKRWINLCLKLTKKSKMPEHRHASVLVKGGKVLAVGINKNKAGMLADPVYGPKGWHSEADCLLSIHKNKVRKAELYVAGITKSGKLVNSKPCPCCQEFIKKYDLKGVFYHDECGNLHRYA